MNKLCKKCLIDKPITEFIKCKNSKDGLRNECKLCRKEYLVQFKTKNPDYFINYNLKYKIKRSGDYHSYNSRLEVKLRKSLHYLKNIDKYKLLRETEEYKKKKYLYNKTSIAQINRNFLHGTLRRLGKKKEGKTVEILGYSALELKHHLEKLFTSGMTWENYGEWHIDHIKPISEFNPETSIKIINSLNNLQPLWATSRLIDGVFYEGNLNKKNKYFG